jgi:predicted glycogen debranching enzyme
MIVIDKTSFQNFRDSSTHEWLETNGLGGWSGTTLCGAHGRRYHGLFTPAVTPPTERMVLLSKMDETIVTRGERFELGTNDYGNAIHPNGYTHLKRFEKSIFPEFIFQAGNITLKKTIAMIHGENTMVIAYQVLETVDSFELELLPLIAGRGYHQLIHINKDIDSTVQFEGDVFHLKPYPATPDLFIKIKNANFSPAPNWYYNFNYSIEQYRGLDYLEDLFSPGRFSIELKQGDSLEIIISVDDPANKNGAQLLKQEIVRRQALLNGQPDNEIVHQLVLAADQFIVQRMVRTARNEKIIGATIIAGYHWFTDWGRDTMISLPGLCLSTGRFEDAKKILQAFAHSVSEGMLPNRFQDDGKEPEYNNVDGTLWYFIAVYKYLRATNDIEFILQEILPVLKNIIDWHFKGTRYNIHADEDGLLYAGEPGQQLTWMDARIADYVVTPRMGKPVEIQALWFNALKIFSELLSLNSQHHDAAIVEISAGNVIRNFEKVFWFEDGGYLYDVIDEKGIPDKSFRPNQLFAISLPFPLVAGDRAKSVLHLIRDELYTPAGLRTLPAKDSRYVPIYGGDQRRRDTSYHQGTVWSWLLGPYVDAMAHTGFSKEEMKQIIDNVAYHLQEGCIGSISEIFDAEPPHHPRGCAAQAWGVAEILRVIKDYDLIPHSRVATD